MQFALMIYETPEQFSKRRNGPDDPYIAAWRSYFTAMVEAGIHVGGDPLEVPETATTVRLQDGHRRLQDGPFADTKEQLAGFIILELPSIDVALDWAARCPAAAGGAVEARPLSPESKQRITA